MAITLFEKPNCRGDSMSITDDHDTLRRTRVGNNPSSIRMSSDDDAILLFKKSDWHGEVMYLRGRQTISDLGDSDDGGRKGFGNSITSVRVDPFEVKLNINIVTGEDGTLPGNWTSRSEAEDDINTIIKMANEFYEDEKALIKVKLGDLTYQADEKYYRFNKKERKSIPGSWRKSRMIDIVFPDTIEGAVGLGKFPGTGKFCLVAAERANVDKMARTFVHELGHYWSLSHRDAEENIMTQSKDGIHIEDSLLKPWQIEDIHQVLARNLTRRGERIE